MFRFKPDWVRAQGCYEQAGAGRTRPRAGSAARAGRAADPTPARAARPCATAGMYKSIREKEKAMVAYEKAAEACERTDAYVAARGSTRGPRARR